MWKKFNNTFEVSNTGEVRFSKSKSLFPVSAKYDKNGQQNGYRYLRTLNPVRNRPMHRLVATLFVENPCPKTSNNNPYYFNVVDHRDGCRANNHFTNLLWVNPHLNAINRCPRGVFYDLEEKKWKSIIKCKEKITG